MKLYGGNSGRKRRQTPKRTDDRVYEETRVAGAFEDDEPARQRTPEELKHIERMIERYQRYKRRKRILIVSILLVLAAVGTIVWRSLIRPPEVAPPSAVTATPSNSSAAATANIASYNRKTGFYTFLLLGKDVEAGLTDTILVGAIDTANNTLNVVSIPRDTLINVSRSYKKANGMYSHNGGNIDKLKAELKTLLGFTVDCYAIVDIKAFEKIVDTIGGVDFDVPVNMDYDDDIQDFRVHLMAGNQHLNGEAALGVVRFRQNNEGSKYGPGYPRADIDRIATQQSFMKAVAKQCLRIGNVTKVNEFAQIFKDYVDTNLSTGNMVWFGQQFLNIKSENINFMTMPAKYDDYALEMACVTVKLDEWLEMINSKLNPYKEEITKEKLDVLTRDSGGNLYSTAGKILS